MPLCKSPSNMEAASPAKVGPREHPASPPSARRAKRGVPPFGMVLDAVLKVPGQRIPTDRPQMPQPRRLIAGSGDKDTIRYPTIHEKELAFINWFKFILSPYFPYMAREAPIKVAKNMGPARSPMVLET